MAETSSFSHTITDHSPDIFPTPKLPNLTSKDIRVLIAHVLNRFLVITKFLVLMTILSSSKAIAALANSVVRGERPSFFRSRKSSHTATLFLPRAYLQLQPCPVLRPNHLASDCIGNHHDGFRNTWRQIKTSQLFIDLFPPLFVKASSIIAFRTTNVLSAASRRV